MRRETRHPDRLNSDLVTAANKRGSHIVGHPAAAAADWRVFVAKDEDLHRLEKTVAACGMGILPMRKIQQDMGKMPMPRNIFYKAGFHFRNRS